MLDTLLNTPLKYIVTDTSWIHLNTEASYVSNPAISRYIPSHQIRSEYVSNTRIWPSPPKLPLRALDTLAERLRYAYSAFTLPFLTQVAAKEAGDALDTSRIRVRYVVACHSPPASAHAQLSSLALGAKAEPPSLRLPQPTPNLLTCPGR